MLKKWINRVLLLLALLFFGSYIVRHFDWETIKTIRVDPLWLVIAVVINFFYMVSYSLLWHMITKSNTLSIPFKEAISIWLFSNIGKYFPLKMVGIGYRVTAYQKRTGKRYIELLQLCYIESLASLLGGCVVVISLYFLFNEQDFISGQNIYLFVIFAIGLLVMLMPSVQNKLLQIALKMLKKEPVIIKMSILKSVCFVTAYAIAWLILGTVLYCLARSLSTSSMKAQDWLAITLVYTAGGLAGIISIFAPSGIGVRESVLVLGLSIVMPPPIAVVLTILARIVSTAVEWSGILIGFVYLEKK